VLTTRYNLQRNSNPIPPADEERYRKVKNSMAAIKLVLDERRKIKAILEKEKSDVKTTN
jgi:hypothetical protein